MSKEKIAFVASAVRESRITTRKMGRVKEGEGEEEGEEGNFPSPNNFPRRQNTENPVPRSFFAPKPHGNACRAG